MLQEGFDRVHKDIIERLGELSEGPVEYTDFTEFTRWYSLFSRRVLDLHRCVHHAYRMTTNVRTGLVPCQMTHVVDKTKVRAAFSLAAASLDIPFKRTLSSPLIEFLARKPTYKYFWFPDCEQRGNTPQTIEFALRSTLVAHRRSIVRNRYTLRCSPGRNSTVMVRLRK